MCAQIIEARVKQKKDTLANWNANPMILLDGEQAFVVGSTGQPINFKIGDGTKRFSDLPFWIQYDQAAFVPVSGLSLPTPTQSVAYTILGEGTYTHSAGNVVVPAGHWGVANWNGSAWSFSDMGSLPKGEDGKTIEQFNETKPGGYVAGDQVLFNNSIFEVKAGQTATTGQSPTTNPEKFTVVLDTENLVSKSDIKSTSVNLFDKSTMVELNKLVNSSGVIQSVAGWHTMKLDVSGHEVGQQITFFGKTGAQGLYWAFYNGATLITPWSAVANSYNPTLPKTVTVPENATWLYVTIKTPADADASVYANFMVNLGATILPFQPYEAFISEIDGKKIAASSGGEAYDQSLNTTDDVQFNSVTANDVEINGVIKSGTLSVPPAGLVSGEFWLDTTDSSIHPIVRRMS